MKTILQIQHLMKLEPEYSHRSKSIENSRGPISNVKPTTSTTRREPFDSKRLSILQTPKKLPRYFLWTLVRFILPSGKADRSYSRRFLSFYSLGKYRDPKPSSNERKSYVLFTEYPSRSSADVVWTVYRKIELRLPVGEGFYSIDIEIGLIGD